MSIRMAALRFTVLSEIMLDIYAVIPQEQGGACQNLHGEWFILYDVEDRGPRYGENLY